MKLYGISHCDSIKKARKQLQADGIDYDFIDLKTAELSDELLYTWLQALPKTLVNKRSTTYRSIKVDWLAAADDITKQIALLQAHPTLIKRPLIEHDNGELSVGWPVK